MALPACLLSPMQNVMCHGRRGDGVGGRQVSPDSLSPKLPAVIRPAVKLGKKKRPDSLLNYSISSMLI